MADSDESSGSDDDDEDEDAQVVDRDDDDFLLGAVSGWTAETGCSARGEWGGCVDPGPSAVDPLRQDARHRASGGVV